MIDLTTRETSLTSHRRFVTDLELMGDIGTSLDTLPRITLRSWGFDPSKPITTWYDPWELGWWIVQAAVEPIEPHDATLVDDGDALRGIMLGVLLGLALWTLLFVLVVR